MIPSWTSTLILICTFNPSRSFFKLSTNTFVWIIIFLFMLLRSNLRFLLLFWRRQLLLLYLYYWCRLFDFLWLDIFEHDFLQTEWVKESPFSQWLYLFRINSSNSKCATISQMNDFTILWNLWYFLMRLCDSLFFYYKKNYLNEQILIQHSRNWWFNLLELFFNSRIRFDLSHKLLLFMLLDVKTKFA